ncbi:MAG TPA: hypothetical protein H9694_07035 [Firmicutes bacterium]|nr:hypothetical protein [Bacillota bacterium]
MLKKWLSLFVTACLIASPSVVSADTAAPLSLDASAEYIQVAPSFRASSVDDILDAYMAFRTDSLVDSKEVTASGQSLLTAENLSALDSYINTHSVFSETVISEEQRRRPLIEDMEERLDLVIRDADTEVSVISRQELGNQVIVDCYVVTTFWYVDASKKDDPSAPWDESAFGIDHLLTFEKAEDGAYYLLSDAYDEGPLTGMRSRSY